MPRPRSDIKERIVEIAREVFLDKGVDGASLRAIARQADTNIGMIYYYFPTKDELFLEVVEHDYVGVLARLQEAIDPEKDFQARLRGLFTFLGTLSEDEVRVLKLILRESTTSHERMERVIARFKRGHVPLLIDLVGQGIREGAIDRKRNPFLAMACLAGIGIAPQIFFRVLAGQLPEMGANAQLSDSLPDEQVELYLRALGPDEPDKPTKGQET